MRNLQSLGCASLLALSAFACSTTDEGSGPLPSLADSGEPGADANDGADAGVADANGTPTDGAINHGYTWWQDVQPIVAVKCQLCHASPPQFGAPRSLVSYADTQALHSSGAPVHQVMAFRIVADRSAMPPPNQPALTAEEISIIRAWSQSGAPEGTPPGDAGVPTPDAGVDTPDAGGPTRNVSRTFEIKARAPGSTDPYVLPTRNTNYVCWAFTVPPGNGAEEHAFRFEPIIDNTANTHHLLLFTNSDGNSPTDGPFDCGGFPLSWNMVAGWAPGRTADEIPAGAGVPVRAGTQLVLQVHYDNVNTAGTTDESGIRVLLTDEPNLEPAGMVWAGVVWNNALNGPNVTKTHTCTLRQPITIFSVFPHMHQLGKSITLEVQRQGESTWTTLVNIPAWSFEDQPNVEVPLSEQQFVNGDRLRTTCTWDTMGQSVGFGEASDDEMCFNFLYHYPLISNQYACVGAQL